jgi:hypothetical protein
MANGAALVPDTSDVIFFGLLIIVIYIVSKQLKRARIPQSPRTAAKKGF